MSDEAEFVQLVAPKFSPLLLVLLPSELLVRHLLEDVFSVLEEYDLKLTLLTASFSASVLLSARDFVLDFRWVPVAKHECLKITLLCLERSHV